MEDTDATSDRECNGDGGVRMDNKRLKIVYLTPALYMAGGVERVLTLKANKALCNVHRFKMDLIAQRWKTLFDEVCR